MRRWAVAVSCVLVLGGSSSGLAQQQQTGPATLEGLLNSDEAQKPFAAAETDAGPKRPAGTVTRPKDGVQHPDLDKAWADYDAAVAKVTESMKAAISKQFDAATAKGDLDAAEKWQVIGETFEKAGELPAENEMKTAVVAAAVEYKKAKEELTKAYEAVVIGLTMEKKIAEAKAARNEARMVMPSGVSEAQTVKAHRDARDAVFLSDLQAENVSVGWGSLGRNGSLGWDGQSITVQGVTPRKGLSMHPPSGGASRATFAVPKNAVAFEGVAALNDSAGGQVTPVTFKVFGDGKLLWASKPLRGAQASEKVSLPMNGARKITLVVECPGDYHLAHAVWCDPCFTSK